MESRYKVLMSQIESLKDEADKARREEMQTVIAEIRQKMADFGISISDLGKEKKGRRSSGNIAPKYRDPKTGDTWTGRGRAPRWLVAAEESGASRDDFLIAQ